MTPFFLSVCELKMQITGFSISLDILCYRIAFSALKMLHWPTSAIRGVDSNLSRNAPIPAKRRKKIWLFKRESSARILSWGEG